MTPLPSRSTSPRRRACADRAFLGQLPAAHPPVILGPARQVELLVGLHVARRHVQHLLASLSLGGQKHPYRHQRHQDDCRDEGYHVPIGAPRHPNPGPVEPKDVPVGAVAGFPLRSFTPSCIEIPVLGHAPGCSRSAEALSHEPHQSYVSAPRHVTDEPILQHPLRRQTRSPRWRYERHDAFGPLWGDPGSINCSTSPPKAQTVVSIWVSTAPAHSRVRELGLQHAADPDAGDSRRQPGSNGGTGVRRDRRRHPAGPLRGDDTLDSSDRTHPTATSQTPGQLLVGNLDTVATNTAAGAGLVLADTDVRIPSADPTRPLNAVAGTMGGRRAHTRMDNLV